MDPPNSFRDWLGDRTVWQIVLSYAVGAWVVLEVTATLSEVAGLPPIFPRFVLVLLIVGLLAVVATALVQQSLGPLESVGSSALRLRRILTWRNVGYAGVSTFALVGVAATVSSAARGLGLTESGREGSPEGARWATEEAIPRVLALAQQGELIEAYRVAVEAEHHVSDHPALRAAWADIARYTSVVTIPAGAMVEIRPYDAPEDAWWSLGTTPLDAVRIPVGFFRWRIRLDGYQDVEMASSGLQFPRVEAHSGLRLVPAGDGPDGMVEVAGGETALGIPQLMDREPVELGAYFLDRYEVTNRAYRAFVAAGGYRDPSWWTEPFVRDGADVSFEDAVPAFVDRTGRPGPATWVAGDHPEGEGNHPVTGLSWYEAAAFARFVGKELPTVHHWHRAAGTESASRILPASNVGGRGPAPVGSFAGMGPFGAYDMAGNAKEWVRNSDGEGRFYILGGGWTDPGHLFREAESLPPWDRSETNGVRLMLPKATYAAGALEPLVRRGDAPGTRAVPDPVWAAYAALYDYDPLPIEPAVDGVLAGGQRRVERVSYRAAYGDGRVPALLFLPPGGRPPFQVVVAFPGSGALAGGDVEASSHPMVDLIVRSGRAVLLPVYAGTYQRATGLADDNPDLTAAYRDHVVMWSKDLGRSIDYLETRADIDASKIGYYGVSWGAGIGPVLAAVEPRLRALVLHAGGFWSTETRPEVDQRVFAPRVTAPTLLLNGRFDAFFPLETAQLPLYHALGTPPEAKRHVVYETGHSTPEIETIGEILAWYDEHLGPVR